MKKVIVKDYLQLIGIKNFKGENKMIDYYIIWPGKERIYAFSKKYFQKDENKRTENFMAFLNVMAKRISEGATVPMPFADVNNVLFDGLDIDHVKVGDTVQIQEEVRLRMDTMMDGDGGFWLPLFINTRELNKGETGNVTMPVTIYEVLKSGLNREDLKGVVINPFGRAFTMPKELLKKFLDDYEAWSKKEEIEVTV